MKLNFQITAVLLFLGQAAFSQELDSTLFKEINALRGPKHQLKYDTARQAYVDWYVSTKGFKKLIHSSLNCGEIIAATPNMEDFVSLWLRSRPHAKNMKDKKWKSMASRVVEVRKGYYHAVVQFYR